MRMRSCLLYCCAFILVAVVCVFIAFGIISGSERDAAVSRLEATMAEKGLSLEPATVRVAPEATDEEGGAQPPAPSETSETQIAFTQLRARMDASKAAGPWSTMSELFMGDTPPSEWTDAQWAEMRTFLSDKRSIIEEIRRIAASGEPLARLEWPIDFDTNLSHLSVAREMAKLLAMDALLGSHEGDLGRMLQDIEGCMGLAQAVARDGVIISSLVANAISGITYNVVRDGIAPGTLSRDQTTTLVRQLENLRGHEALLAGLTGEARRGRSLFEGIADGDLDLPEELGMSGLDTFYGNVLTRPLLQLDEAAHAEVMDTLLRAADQPYYEVRPEVEALEEELTTGLPFLRPMTRVLTPALSNVLATQARLETQVDLARMGLLLELHRAETGRYPQSLDAIASDLGGSVPVDPFTGDPYRYIPQGENFLLYSLGRNATDDDGRQGWRGGDLVWRGVEADLTR